MRPHSSASTGQRARNSMAWSCVSCADRIWNSAGQFNPALASPITWMASIARNRAIDLVRKRSELSIEDEPAAMEVAADSPDPLARREMTEELKRLLECVGRLEPDRQKLVLLAYYNGWSREQLATKF